MNKHTFLCIFTYKKRCTLLLPSFICPPLSSPASSASLPSSPCVHFSLQLSLLCIHQDGNGQASWLHLKRHTYQGALSLCICHFPFGWNMAPVSALAEYITLPLPLSLCIAAQLCCHRYHAAVQVRKGLSGYSSHYWLLNLVMVVKALPVPPCLRGQLMACFMSLQRRASLLGHRFHSHRPPTPVHAPSQRRDGWIGGLRTTIYTSLSAGAKPEPPKKSLRSPTLLLGGWEALCDLWLQIIWSD